MLAAVLLLGGVFERIPLSVLAVILIVTMWEKLDFQALKTVFGGKKPIQIILFFSVRRCNGFSRTALCDASVCCCNNLLSAAYTEKKVKT